MLRRTLPYLHRLPRGLASATGVQPQRFYSFSMLEGTASCPICGGGSLVQGLCCTRCGSCFPYARHPTSMLYSSPSPASLRPAFETPTLLQQLPQLIRPKYPGRIQLLDGHNQLKCEAPLTYFTRIPILVKASDPNDGLHMILTPKPQRPWLLSESGKFSFHSLIELVASTHQEGWTVGAGQLSLENLVVVSEVGIFKFKHSVARYALNDDNRAEDFHALAKVMTSLLASLHGDSVVSCLPIDFSMLLDDLSGVTDPELQHISTENHPSLLPSSSYGVSIMKFHGLFAAADGNIKGRERK